MGRKKRDASTEKSFEEIKKESLENLTKEKESISQDIIDQFDDTCLDCRDNIRAF